MICPNCGFDNVPGSESCSECVQDLTHLDLPQPQERLEEELLRETVGKLELAPPVTIRADETIQAALTAMVKHAANALLVVNHEEKLIGLISERDIALRYAGDPSLHPDLLVSQFMTPDPVTVTPSETLAYALQKMDVGNYRHLPVVEADRIVGLATVRALLRFVNRSLREQSGT
ncbi:MAG TPA: CBS domain-containing protein [Gemmatales bacterium]|nr:CBS domain-containing protein [Gemmatales bacterium]HMP60629.1 CBS domain-containing protein [Gemmatales bacterium]